MKETNGKSVTETTTTTDMSSYAKELSRQLANAKALCAATAEEDPEHEELQLRVTQLRAQQSAAMCTYHLQLIESVRGMLNPATLERAREMAAAARRAGVVHETARTKAKRAETLAALQREEEPLRELSTTVLSASLTTLCFIRDVEAADATYKRVATLHNNSRRRGGVGRYRRALSKARAQLVTAERAWQLAERRIRDIE